MQRASKGNKYLLFPHKSTSNKESNSIRGRSEKYFSNKQTTIFEVNTIKRNGSEKMSH